MTIQMANRLTDLRKQHNLTQEELADKIGVSRQTISKWEGALASPDTDNLIALSKLYGISIDELLDVDNKSSNNEDEIEKEAVEDVEVVTDEKKENKNANKNKYSRRAKRDFIILSSCVIIFFILGFTVPNAWRWCWLVILASLVISSAIEAILRKKLSKFSYTIFVTIIFMAVGLLADVWHPTWVIFLSVPIYYTIVALIEYKKEQKDKDDDDED